MIVGYNTRRGAESFEGTQGKGNGWELLPEEKIGVDTKC